MLIDARLPKAYTYSSTVIQIIFVKIYMLSISSTGLNLLDLLYMTSAVKNKSSFYSLWTVCHDVGILSIHFQFYFIIIGLRVSKLVLLPVSIAFSLLCDCRPN